MIDKYFSQTNNCNCYCNCNQVWDAEEPEHKEAGREPVCPVLWHRTPLPFVKVFQNSEYAVLRVAARARAIMPPTRDM